jgi:hypothetical protein
MQFERSTNLAEFNKLLRKRVISTSEFNAFCMQTLSDVKLILTTQTDKSEIVMALTTYISLLKSAVADFHKKLKCPEFTSSAVESVIIPIYATVKLILSSLDVNCFIF